MDMEFILSKIEFRIIPIAINHEGLGCHSKVLIHHVGTLPYTIPPFQTPVGTHK